MTSATWLMYKIQSLQNTYACASVFALQQELKKTNRCIFSMSDYIVVQFYL